MIPTPFPMAVVAVAMALAARSARADGALDRPDALQCGTMALYHLLRMEGADVTVEAIQARLPRPRPEGYSMKELRAAASACGVRLDGVLLKKSAEAIDRPMLVFVDRGGHGHYIVARPVGRTGKLV